MRLPLIFYWSLAFMALLPRALKLNSRNVKMWLTRHLKFSNHLQATVFSQRVKAGYGAGARSTPDLLFILLFVLMRRLLRLSQCTPLHTAPSWLRDSHMFDDDGEVLYSIQLVHDEGDWWVGHAVDRLASICCNRTEPHTPGSGNHSPQPDTAHSLKKYTLLTTNYLSTVPCRNRLIFLYSRRVV